MIQFVGVEQEQVSSALADLWVQRVAAGVQLLEVPVSAVVELDHYLFFCFAIFLNSVEKAFVRFSVANGFVSASLQAVGSGTLLFFTCIAGIEHAIA